MSFLGASVLQCLFQLGLIAALKWVLGCDSLADGMVVSQGKTKWLNM